MKNNFSVVKIDVPRYHYFTMEGEQMGTKEKMQNIEKLFGGPVAASRAAGVRYATWYRWREGRLPCGSRLEKLLDLLLKSAS